MSTFVELYSDKNGEIIKFLNKFYNSNILNLKNDLFWRKEYKNPVAIADIIASLIDNKENYKINMWISLDKNVFINVNKNNVDKIIRYLFERYPY